MHFITIFCPRQLPVSYPPVYLIFALSLTPFAAHKNTLSFFTRLPFFFFINLFIYLFLAVLGLRFCARAYLQLRRAGATLHRGARASHYRGPSRCGAQAPDAQAQ